MNKLTIRAITAVACFVWACLFGRGICSDFPMLGIGVAAIWNLMCVKFFFEDYLRD